MRVRTRILTAAIGAAVALDVDAGIAVSTAQPHVLPAVGLAAYVAASGSHDAPGE